MSKNLDQPANPVTNCQDHEFVGLTIRDHFAGLAMQGFMAWALRERAPDGYDSAAKISAAYAESAYMIADAMLEERAK